MSSPARLEQYRPIVYFQYRPGKRRGALLQEEFNEQDAYLYCSVSCELSTWR